MQFITSIAFLVIAAAGVFAQFHIDTPSGVVVCQPTKLTFGGGTPPYSISMHPAGQVNAPALETLPSTNDTAITWLVDFLGGTSLTIVIKDMTGTLAESAIITVQTGSDSSCVGKNSSVAPGSGSATAPASTASGSAIPSVTSASAPNPSSSAASSGSAAAASSGSPAASASASTKPNAASSLSSSSASGIIGMMLAALLV